MNVLKSHPGFVDPFLWDAPLADEGVRTATELSWFASRLWDANVRPELVAVSPFRRAIRTAQLALATPLAHGVPIAVSPLNGEAVSDSGDCGRAVDEIAADFPELDLSDMPRLWWWPGPPDADGRVPATPDEAHEAYRRLRYVEPEDVVAARAARWRRWLADRPEQVIWVVGHGDMIRVTTGVKTHPRNLGLVVCALHTLTAELNVVHSGDAPSRDMCD